jgi:hypothetical protein
MAQVTEHLSSKHEALSSNPSSMKERKKEIIHNAAQHRGAE